MVFLYFVISKVWTLPGLEMLSVLAFSFSEKLIGKGKTREESCTRVELNTCQRMRSRHEAHCDVE